MMRRLLLVALMLPLAVTSLWAQEPYAVLSTENTVLTFFYDNQRESRGGISLDAFTAGTGTAEHPFSVAEAIAKCMELESGNTSTEYYYIKGIAVTEGTAHATFGDVSFYIGDDVNAEYKFYVYCAFGSDGQKLGEDFTIHVGDEVLVYGKITTYNGTPETSRGAHIVSVNGNATDGGSVTLAELVNGNFETWADGLPTGWKSACTASSATLEKSTDAYNGSYSVLVKGDANNNKRLASQEIALAAGSYTFSFMVKPTTTDVSQVRPGYVPVTDGMVGSYTYGNNYVTLDQGWQQVSYDFTLSSDAIVCLVVLNPKKSSYSSGTDVLIDDAVLSVNSQAKSFRASSIVPDVAQGVTTVVFDESFAGCTNIVSTAGWFEGFSNLTTVTGLEYLKTDYVTNMSSMFSGCSSLKSLDMSGLNASRTSSTSLMFQNCSSLTSIMLPTGINMPYNIFLGCTSLTSIGLPYNAKIGGNTFSGMTSVTDIHILGDAMATWNPQYLPGCTVWVPESLYSSYQNWISEYGMDILSESWEPKQVNIAVNTAGGMAAQILSVVGKWTDVDELTVSGHLNASDMKYFSNLHNVHKIDLSQTDITSISGCTGLKLLREVVLPATVKTVEASAFEGCSRLRTINLPTATTIGERAFYECSSLASIDLPIATTIGETAFSSCSSLASINLLAATTIGNRAFGDCSSLVSVDLPTAIELGRSAFAYCSSLMSVNAPLVVTVGSTNYYYDGTGCFHECTSLTSISLPSATFIGSQTFRGCSALTQVELPAVMHIDDQAFYYCEALTSIELPASLQEIRNYCFSGCTNLKDIYCHVAVPFPTNAFSDAFPSGVTLHVPAFSLSAYQLHTDWGGYMGSIVPMEGNIDQLNVNTDFAVISTEGLTEKPTLKVESVNDDYYSRSGHLDIITKTPWQLDKLDYENYKWVYGSRKNWTYPYCNTMITQNEVTADKVDLSFCVQTDEWNFICIPFDVNVSDIEWPENTLWAIRHYSGADRAALTGNTWQDMTAGMTLQAGEGYILQCTNGDPDETGLMLKIHAVDNDKKNRIFAYQDVAQPLTQYDSELAHNRGWNLVGNPYPAYYQTNQISHNGVITVWNGNGYTAYSLQDDQYVLHPFEAFFVQRSDAETMTFAAAGRSHSLTVDGSGVRADKRAAGQADRHVFNFTLSGADGTDRARLVVNPQAKADYETCCDAAKMTAAAQPAALYVLDGGVRYAINECPLGNGEFQLGISLNEGGTYTLRLQQPQADGTTVALTDHETGRRTDLRNDSYTFTAKAGTSDNRFTLTLGGDITGIKDHNREMTSNNREVYDLSGRRMVNGKWPKGIYVVNGRKVVVTE